MSEYKYMRNMNQEELRTEYSKARGKVLEINKSTEILKALTYFEMTIIYLDRTEVDDEKMKELTKWMKTKSITVWFDENKVKSEGKYVDKEDFVAGENEFFYIKFDKSGVMIYNDSEILSFYPHSVISNVEMFVNKEELIRNK